MPDAGPKVIVTFYDNFRFVPVDIHGVFGSNFSSGTQAMTGRYFSSEVPEGEDRPISAKYSSFKVHVESGSGTWKLIIKLQGVEHESAPIPYNATPLQIAEAFTGIEVIPADAVKPVYEQVGEGPFGEPVFAGVQEFIEVLELPGAQEWELRLFEDSGVIFPSGASVQTIDIDLGEVIVMKPEWDEIPYEVNLAEGCGGIGPPPPGEINPGDSRRGTVPSRNPVVGRRT